MTANFEAGLNRRLRKRKPKQTSLWGETSQLRAQGPPPFYDRVNEILGRAKFDVYVERICGDCYAPAAGRPPMSLGTHRAVFRWVLKRLAGEDLLKRKTAGVGAMTLEANAALRSLVRRGNGAGYGEHVGHQCESQL